MNAVFRRLLGHNAVHAREFDSRFDGLQTGQDPDAVTVCCSDSRVLQDHLWANDEPGQLFTCANIGNRVIQRTSVGNGDGLSVSGDVLYPLVHLDTGLAIVVGHTGCGAVTAAYDDLTDGLEEPPGIAGCLDLLEPGLEQSVRALPAGIAREEAVNRLVELNVDRQVEHLVGSEDVPSTVDVVGVVYDFQDVYGGNRGEVHVVNVDGETDVESLCADHPQFASRIDRLDAG